MKKILLIGIVVTVGILVLTLPITSAGSRPAVHALVEPRAENLVATTLPDVEISVDEVIATGFDRPIQVTHAGDGSDRLFVVEQTGEIRIFKNGAILSAPFIDLGSLVACCGEQGLLGLAFHPDYANPTNRYFYVNYTRASDGDTVIARYRANAGDPDVANPNSETILLTIDQPYANHNGGQLLFSPVDGYLYIGMGDGGSGGDPLDAGQDINSLLGAILRLDVDGGSPYAIPADNPYVGVDGLDEIWAIGVRNPWRFSFDRLNGDLYIGDVGQNVWEEISYQAGGTPGGTNFGWRCKEGTHDYNFTGDCLTADLTDPIAEYSHAEGYSVTGGFVYRGTYFPNLVGRYFYADFVEGKIWSLYQTGSEPDTWSTPELELDTGFNISAFGEDEEGEIYVADYHGGAIRHLVDVNNPSPNLSPSTKKVSTPSADPAEVVTYTLWISNTGGLADQPVVLTDTIPSGLAYVPGSLASIYGTGNDTTAPTLTWAGNLNESQAMSITYQVQVTGLVTGSLINQAVLHVPAIQTLNLYQTLAVPRSVLTTTVEDFSFPGTQPGELNLSLQTALDCDQCHSEPIYDRWRGSMMGQAGRDPLMWAALHVANVDAPNAGEYCLRCHTPKGWFEGRSHPPDGSALQGEDINSGVACALCHRMVDTVPSESDEAKDLDADIREALSNPIPDGFIGSGSMILDPDDNRRGPFSFDPPNPYHSSYQTDFLAQTGEAVTRSSFCGTCHNVYNPVLSWDEGESRYWPNEMDTAPPAYSGETLFPIETTFDEWLYSDFAQGGIYAPQFAGQKADGIVETCQDCHMPRVTGTAADAAFNPVYRDCLTSGCLPEHTFAGGNAWVPLLLQNPAWRLTSELDGAYLDETVRQAESMLQRAATISVTLTTTDTGKLATVMVVNHSGHKLPTGYPEGRQMWVHLVAYDAMRNVVYESGAYDWTHGVLVRDPEIKVYEAKQGISPDLAAVLGKQAGESFHFVLNNMVVKDNRIPPQGYTVANFDKPGLRPVGAAYADDQHWDQTTYLLPAETELVSATLYYQTASKEYIDFLRSHGGVDGLTLGTLWEGSKSPPVAMTRDWSQYIRFHLPLLFGGVPTIKGISLAGWLDQLLTLLIQGL
jgi:uncharacterized repeat protein (TIGR01451 family)